MTTPLTPLAKWHRIYDRFDPFGVRIDEYWIVPRASSPAKKLLTKLNRPIDPHPILLLGTVGCGKTTELQYLSGELSSKYFVVFFDLQSHFSAALKDPAALDKIQPWEVCFLAGVAFIKAVKTQYDYDFPPELLQPLADSWTKLATSSESISGNSKQLDLSSLAGSLAVLVSKVSGVELVGELVSAAAGAVPWNLPLGKGKKKIEDQDQPVKDLLDAVNRLIYAFHRQFSRDVVLVLDGLDRIKNIVIARELFDESNLLASIDCRLIVCAPTALRHAVGLGNSQFDIAVLFNEPVLSQTKPEDPGSGIDFFLEVYRRRTIDLDPGQTIVQPHHLKKLAYYSGGQIREFLRLIRGLAEMGLEEPAPESSTDEMIKEVLDDARRRVEMGLNKAHIDLLKSLMEDEKHRLPDGDLALELLTSLRLFPYPDGSEWFYPHPLLTINLLK